jgi:flagella basal body P-ring formation protein FlgA
MKKKLNAIFIMLTILSGTWFLFGQAYAEVRVNTGIREVSLSGPETITITRDSREITHKEVEEILRQYIAKQAGQSGVKAEVKNIRYSGNILLPSTRNIEYDVIPSSNFHYVGTNYFFIVFKSNGRVLKKVKIEAETDMKVSIVYAARPIERGQTISENDIYLEEKDVSAVPQRVVFNPKEVIGKKAKRNIPASMMLRSNLVEYPSAVKKGDLVTILAQSGGLWISTKGEAVEDGIVGETIKVKNLRSKKIVGGTIVERGIVKVDF